MSATKPPAPTVAWMWDWMSAGQRVEAMTSALAHPMPSVRARAMRCQADDEGARECLWLHQGGTSWLCMAALWPDDLRRGVVLGVRP